MHIYLLAHSICWKFQSILCTVQLIAHNLFKKYNRIRAYWFLLKIKKWKQNLCHSAKRSVSVEYFVIFCWTSHIELNSTRKLYLYSKILYNSRIAVCCALCAIYLVFVVHNIQYIIRYCYLIWHYLNELKKKTIKNRKWIGLMFTATSTLCSLYNATLHSDNITNY